MNTDYNKAIKLMIAAKQANATALDLSNLDIAIIPPKIIQLPQLTDLNISNTKISNLSILDKLPNLITVTTHNLTITTWYRMYPF